MNSKLTELSAAQILAEQALTEQKDENNIIVPGLAQMLLKSSVGYENIKDLTENLKNSMLNLIDTVETPKTVSEEQILGTMLFKNIVFDNPDFVSKLCYLVLTKLTKDFADGTKQFFMPAEALCINYAWLCFLHTNLSSNDTLNVFNPSIDLTFELPSFISKDDQDKIKELINKFSSYEKDDIRFLSFSPYNSFDFNDYSFQNTPDSDNGDVFLLSLISLLYYYKLMIYKEKERNETKDNDKNDLKIQIETNEDRIDKYTNYLNDFKENLPNAADILNAYKPKRKEA